MTFVKMYLDGCSDNSITVLRPKLSEMSCGYRQASRR